MTDHIVEAVTDLANHLLMTTELDTAPGFWHLETIPNLGETWILHITHEDKDDMAIAMLAHKVPASVDLVAMSFSARAVHLSAMQGFDGTPAQHPDARRIMSVVGLARDGTVITVIDGFTDERLTLNEMPSSTSILGMAFLSSFGAEEGNDG